METSLHRLLVVDDNSAIHDDFRKILDSSDDVPADMLGLEDQLFGDRPEKVSCPRFELACAGSGQQGFEMVKGAALDGRPFSLVFMDVRMPNGWDGVETAAHVLKHDPDVQVVMCTAFSDYSWGEMMDRLGRSDRVLILKKPFDAIEVMQLAHSLCEKWRLARSARAHMAELEATVQLRTADLARANAQLKLEMEERARVEEALRQSQKMEALGQLAGGVAHDFNNLLTVIRGYAQCLISDGGQTSAAMDGLTQIDAAAERASNLTAQMLLFSRKKRLQREDLELNDVIAHLNKMLRRLLGEDICLHFQPSAEDLWMRADRAMLEQVVMNLAVNARDAMTPDGGVLTIRTDRVQRSDRPVQSEASHRADVFASITVADTGCGIGASVLQHLFEPFYTTKEPGKGTGLGLATVYGIVKQHGGSIDVKTEQGRGTTFTILLPLSESATRSIDKPTSRTATGGGEETILLVEDEEALRTLVSQLLKRSGYRVIPATSGAEALRIWDQHETDVDLLLTDMVMPDGISGRALAQQLQARKPALRTIYTTGYSVDALGDEGLTEGLNFLAKPYHPADLISTVRRCLDEIRPAALALG